MSLPDIKNIYFATNEAIDKYSINKSFLRLKNISDIVSTVVLSANDIMTTFPMATDSAYGFVKFSSDAIEITGNYQADDTTLVTPYLIQKYLENQMSTDYDVPIKINYSSYAATSSDTYDALEETTSANMYSNVYSGNIILLNGLKMYFGYSIISSNNDFSIDDINKFDSIQITFPSNVFNTKPMIYTQIIDCVDSVVSFEDTELMKPEYRTYRKYLSEISNTGFIFNFKQYHIDLGPMILSDKIVYPGFTLQWLAIGI